MRLIDFAIPLNLHPTGGRDGHTATTHSPEPQFQVEDLVTPRRAKFLLWLNTAVQLSVLRLDRK